ncbi:MAG: tyrosine-type recombinase/integrase [Anaerolineales bacterium]
MTFEEMVQAHLKALRRRGRSEVTIASRRAWLGQLGDFLAGRETTIELLREWAEGLQARGLKPRSVWSGVVNVRAFTAWLAEEEITPANIGRRLEKPKLPRRLPKALTLDQVGKILQAAATSLRPERDTALVLFFLDTGCRRAGAANLRMPDLDLEHGSARVVEKGDKERLVYFSGRTTEALRKWLDVRDPQTFHGQYRGSDLMFGLGPWGCGLRIEDLGRRAGVACHAHLLRHTSATMRVMQGADASTLQQLLGWSDLSMLPVYTTLAGDQLQARSLATSPLNRLQAPQTKARRPVRGRFLPFKGTS